MRRVAVPALLLLLTVVLTVAAPRVALAQEDPRPDAPTQDIVPRPNSGEAPEEPGDRGGALQLLVAGLLVVAVGGAAAHLVRQSRRARQ